jgi:hypothetical protein
VRMHGSRTLAWVALWQGLAGCSLVTQFGGLVPAEGGSDGGDAGDGASMTVDVGQESGSSDSGSVHDAADTEVIPADTSSTPDGLTPDTFTPDTSSTDGSTNPCSGRPDGFSLNALDPYSRCCGGVAVETTTDTNCGVCGVACNTALGQSCGLIDGQYLCLDCSSNADCWSGCCAATVSPPHCSANDCATGACATPDPCAAHGAHCTIAGVAYCSY